MTPLTSLLAPHRDRLSGPLAALLEKDPTRLAQFAVQIGELYMDFSKQRIDRELINALLGHADALKWREQAIAMREGAIVNATEHRAVEHMALRARPMKAEFQPAFARMQQLVEQIHSGALRSAAGTAFTDVVHIGIGGSHLGPQLVCEALSQSPEHPARLRVHFVANIDGHAVSALLRSLNRDSTIVIIASKTMTTLETRLNADVVRNWLAPAQDPLAQRRLASQVFAISAAPARAAEFGIAAAHVLPFSDSIGGRFSLWSTIGLPIALQIGWAGFEALHAGARLMDDHFLQAPSAANLPLLAALIGLWNRNGLEYASLGLAPYDERLRLLPAFLQQLEMESNGKSVDRQGNPILDKTVPVLWGQTGTPGQHAYFQCLHQGTDIVPVDFVAVVKPDHDHPQLHRALLENCFGQSRALMCGREHSDPNRRFTGGRPSTTILLDRLSPSAMGSLLALYEHKVFVQGVLWNINSFDQFGVELGKEMAQTLAKGELGGLDASTRALMAKL